MSPVRVAFVCSASIARGCSGAHPLRRSFVLHTTGMMGASGQRRARQANVTGMAVVAEPRDRVLEDTVIVWVALLAASAMTVLTVRSMAYAVAHSIDARPRQARAARPRATRARRGYMSSHEASLLLIEIALSIGIAMTSIGLASMAELPARMLIGALLAQLAVLGSLVAPAMSIRAGSIAVRPAAVALGFAQLANALFFAKAIYALV